jgi:hypothetical protein
MKNYSLKDMIAQDDIKPIFAPGWDSIVKDV